MGTIKILARSYDNVGYVSNNDERLKKDALYTELKRLSYIDDFNIRRYGYHWYDYPLEQKTVACIDGRIANIKFGSEQEIMHYLSNDISWSIINGKNVPSGELGINHYLSYKHKDLLSTLQDIADHERRDVSSIIIFIKIEIAHPGLSFSYTDNGEEKVYNGEFISPEKHNELFSWTIRKDAHISGFAYRYDQVGSYTRVKLKYDNIERIVDIDIGISRPLPSKYTSNIVKISIAQLVNELDTMIGDAMICGGKNFTNIPTNEFMLQPKYMMSNAIRGPVFTIPKNKLPIRRYNIRGLYNPSSLFVAETMLADRMNSYKIYYINKWYLQDSSNKYLFTFNNLISDNITLYLVYVSTRYSYDDDHLEVEDLFRDQDYESLHLRVYKEYK